MRGRVVRIDGVPADQSGIEHWSLRRDRGLSYAAAMPEGTELVAGEWWPEDYAGPPLVSVEDEVARSLRRRDRRHASASTSWGA